ncbi:hypothetical protein CCP1ISM_190007 [Azospirillaceae bacterium]
MRLSEILARIDQSIGEEADHVTALANQNLEQAKKQKKQAQIKKTKSVLANQQTQLSNTTNNHTRS